MDLFKRKKEVKNEVIGDNVLANALNTMANMEEIEMAVEGKVIESLSGNGFGVIIHFTDGTTYKSMGGKVEYDGIPVEKIEMEFDLNSNDKGFKLDVDDEDEYFTGHAYYSCGNPECKKFFGHYNEIPKNNICPKCKRKIIR